VTSADVAVPPISYRTAWLFAGSVVSCELHTVATNGAEGRLRLGERGLEVDAVEVCEEGDHVRVEYFFLLPAGEGGSAGPHGLGEFGAECYEHVVEAEACGVSGFC
jgi:hypothetical protein